MTTATAGRRSKTWRQTLRALHRDVGYLCAAMLAIYAISGVAVNHIDSWNPNYSIAREQRSFAPLAFTDRETTVRHLVDQLDLPGPPVDSFRPSPQVIQLFYDGWNVEARPADGVAVVEHPKERTLLFDFNFLHLNHAKGAWTWVADGVAVLLLFLALSGAIMLRGSQGLAGRGKWFVLAGLLVPLGFLLALRYLSF